MAWRQLLVPISSFLLIPILLMPLPKLIERRAIPENIWYVILSKLHVVNITLPIFNELFM